MLPKYCITTGLRHHYRTASVLLEAKIYLNQMIHKLNKGPINPKTDTTQRERKYKNIIYIHEGLFETVTMQKTR